MSKMTGTPEKDLESTAGKSEDGQLIFLIDPSCIEGVVGCW
jgi:hypothetical protein